MVENVKCMDACKYVIFLFPWGQQLDFRWRGMDKLPVFQSIDRYQNLDTLKLSCNAFFIYFRRVFVFVLFPVLFNMTNVLTVSGKLRAFIFERIDIFFNYTWERHLIITYIFDHGFMVFQAHIFISYNIEARRILSAT